MENVFVGSIYLYRQGNLVEVLQSENKYVDPRNDEVVYRKFGNGRSVEMILMRDEFNGKERLGEFRIKRFVLTELVVK